MKATGRLIRAAAAALSITAIAGLAALDISLSNHPDPGLMCPDSSCSYRTM
jgi:hypothetical protein